MIPIDEDKSDQFRRLCSSSKPINYQLSIRPDLSSLTFSGHVIIDLEVLIHFFVSWFIIVLNI